ncbi:MAG: anaerobic ribonucleoside-triphosphate reductase [Promethearchaeota archaeon]
MSKSRKSISEEEQTSTILSAISSSLRSEILKLLSRETSLSFTEIMQATNIDPRNAGRFGYHLRELKRANLITGGPATGYSLTPIGEKVVDFIWTLEDISRKYLDEIFVRTSRISIEHFDRGKISESLVREASVPKTLAEKIAKEAEIRLMKLKVQYLTSSLIREFVNAILLEKGFEEYRHALTRLGLPVYDITQLIKNPSIKTTRSSPEIVHKLAGDAVLEQYLFMKILPRKVADAHLSGAIHIPHANYWVLKPNEICHDLHTLLQHNFFSAKPPKSLRDILGQISRIIEDTQTNVISEQVFDHFNIFLAPYARPKDIKETKKALRVFFAELNNAFFVQEEHPNSTILLEFTIPSYLKDTPAIGPNNKIVGKYGEYADEASFILNAILDVLIKGDMLGRPFFTPNIVLKIRPEAMETSPQLLIKSHKLASKWGTPYFINMRPEWQNSNACYTGNLTRLESSWKNHWDLGVNRTGNLDWVALNLPQIAIESKGNDSLLFNLIDEYLNIIYETLTIKHKTIHERLRKDHLLPLLMHDVDGEPYYRIENATHTVAILGLDETVKKCIGSSLYEDRDALDFGKTIINHLVDFTKNSTKVSGLRWNTMQTPTSIVAHRLAKLDAEHFGSTNAIAQNAGTTPFYSTSTILASAPISLEKRIELESQIHPLLLGGHMLNIPLSDSRITSKRLLKTTERIYDSNIGFFGYSRNLTYCSRCLGTYQGVQQKCPSCDLSGINLRSVGRAIGTYRQLDKLEPSEKLAVVRQNRYTL